ncbi:MAG: ferritin [Chloroflexi bacterium RBG_13_50_21]|nr:MAG: ferritin [Chloroflexi bacterium RBG_13_50_21]OGO62056.1 MAG: ferritin [Chloroflexi bacterium RBG_19FT_COMBO_50_10]
MISKAIQNAINEQINKELYSSYLYLSMAAYFENKNLPGFAKWMFVQADEERGHGMRLFAHLLERAGKVELKPIAGPETSWNTYLEVFKQVQEHEAAVTSSINTLYELALKEKDYPLQVVLQWFITEQVEEEKNAADIVQQLELIDAKGTAVLMLDHQLGKRGKE